MFDIARYHFEKSESVKKLKMFFCELAITTTTDGLEWWDDLTLIPYTHTVVNTGLGGMGKGLETLQKQISTYFNPCSINHGRHSFF